MKIKNLILLVLPTLALSVNAATTNQNMQVTSRMLSSCSVIGQDVNFGVVDENVKQSFAVPGITKMVRNPIKVKCNKSTAYVLKGKALEYRGTATGMFMKNGITSEEIEYNVWSGTSDFANWFSDGKTYSWGGNQSSKTNGISSAGTGAEQTHILQFALYAQMSFPGKRVTPAGYSDTYSLTVEY